MRFKLEKMIGVFDNGNPFIHNGYKITLLSGKRGLKNA